MDKNDILYPQILKRHISGKIKRRTFERETGHKIFTIGICCLEAGTYKNLISPGILKSLILESAFYILQE